MQRLHKEVHHLIQVLCNPDTPKHHLQARDTSRLRRVDTGNSSSTTARLRLLQANHREAIQVNNHNTVVNQAITSNNTASSSNTLRKVKDDQAVTATFVQTLCDAVFKSLLERTYANFDLDRVASHLQDSSNTVAHPLSSNSSMAALLNSSMESPATSVS